MSPSLSPARWNLVVTLVGLLALGACRSGPEEPTGAEPDAHEGGDDGSTEEHTIPDIAKDASQLNLTLPHVVTVVPTDQSVGVDPGGNIVFTFNTAMDPLSVAAAVRIMNGALQVPGSTTYDPATNAATFDPAADLPPNTQINVLLGQCVSQQGVECDGAALSFTTGS